MRPRFGTSRHLAPLTAALLVAGLLSGCGADNPKPPPLPTPTNTATVPTEPALPDAAKGTTKAAAVEFVKYYVSVLNASALSGNTDELHRLANPDCDVCVSFEKLITDTYTAGGEIRGDGWTVLDAWVSSTGPDGSIDVETRIRVAPQTIDDGDSVQEFAGRKRQTKHFSLAPLRENWSLVDVNSLS